MQKSNYKQVQGIQLLKSLLLNISIFLYLNISPGTVLYHMFLTFVIRRGRDDLLVGFKTTQAISFYHH
jgi:hypothetical protein